jgi:hypothetical protein
MNIEMFKSEIDRYGLWREPLRMVAPSFQQLPLFEGDGRR